MIKSISYWSVRGGLEGTRPVDEAMAEVKQAGFGGIELCVGTEGVLTPQTDQKTCESYRDAARKHGLALQTAASGMSWGVCPTHPDPAIRKRSIELHKGALQRTAWLGCSSMLFVPGAVKIQWDASFPPVKYDDAVKWAREAVTELAKTAKEVNVELCVENVWNGMFYSPLEFAAFIDSFDSPSVGIYFDVGNVVGYHQHPPHWVELLGKRIKRVHVKDFKHNFDWNGNYSFCDLGAGDVPWKETMRALRAIGYDKTMVAEMLPWNEGLVERTSKAMDKILVG